MHENEFIKDFQYIIENIDMKYIKINGIKKY